MTGRFFIVLLITSVSALNAQAKILAKNLSGESLTLSFHGPGCQQFANREDMYPACQEREIGVNETAMFANIIDNQTSPHKREKRIWPKIKFRLLGLRYECRYVDFAVVKLCFPLNYWLGSIRNEQMSPKDSEDHTILADENYLIEILPTWALISRPKMDCRLIQLIEDPVKCKSH